MPVGSWFTVSLPTPPNFSLPSTFKGAKAPAAPGGQNDVRGQTEGGPVLAPEDAPASGWYQGRVGNKKPAQKTHLKNQKNVFFGFFKFFIFYENNTNFSLWNRFFMNK
jgi:hypothetical protein